MMNRCFALVGLLLLAAGASAFGIEDDEHNLNGYMLRVIGKSAKFLAGTNSSSVRVDFGKITERTASGHEISLHQIASLENLNPLYVTGVETIDGANVTFVQMRLPFANFTEAFKYNSSSCSPSVSKAEFLAGSLCIKVFFGFATDTVFPYGLNNTIVAPGNSMKINIEAQNWPFCATTNNLDVSMKNTTPNCEACPTKVSNYTDSTDEEDSTDSANDEDSTDSSSPGSNSTGAGSSASNPGSGHSRRTLAKPNQQGPHEANTPGHQSSKAGRPRDPRVAGRRKDKVAVMTSGDKAAVMDFTTYAYDSVTGTTLYNVTADVKQAGPHTMVTLSFPSFTSLYYDPTLEVDVDATLAGYNTEELTAANAGVSSKNAAASVRVKMLGAMTTGILLLALVL